MQLMAGYSVFANGGFRIMPYFIQRIEDGQGKLVAQAAPSLPARVLNKSSTCATPSSWLT